MSEVSYVFKVGVGCWFKGKTYEIVDIDRSRKHVRIFDNNSDAYPWRVLEIAITQIEPPIEEIFDLGDTVKGKETFHGEVVGFEKLTNRVICKSFNNCNDRTRYAYKWNELEKCAVMSWEIGRSYVITAFNGGAITVKCNMHPENRNMVLLHDALGNLIAVVPRRTKDLKSHSIVAARLIQCGGGEIQVE